eukprot:2822998-Pleurochrysis_carterae.AAC.1
MHLKTRTTCDPSANLRLHIKRACEWWCWLLPPFSGLSTACTRDDLACATLGVQHACFLACSDVRT